MGSELFLRVTPSVTESYCLKVVTEKQMLILVGI